MRLPKVVVLAQFSLLYAQGEMRPNSKAQGDLGYLNENSQSGRGDCSAFFPLGGIGCGGSLLS